MRVNQPVGIVSMTNVAIIKYKTNNKKFEIACYKNKAINWRNGVERELNEVLQVNEIFTNATKGDIASKKELEECFGQIQRDKMIKIILEKGDLQVGEKERGTQISQYYKDLVKFIQEKCVHSISGQQLTIQSIEFAISKVEFTVRTDQNLKRQALQCIKRMKQQFFIKRAPMKIQLSFQEENREAILKILKDLQIEVKEIFNANTILQLTIDPSVFRPLSLQINDKKCQIEVLDAIVKSTVENFDDIGAVELEQRLEKIQISDDDSDHNDEQQKPKTKKQKKQQQQLQQNHQHQQQHQKEQQQQQQQQQPQQQQQQPSQQMDKQFKCTTCQISFDTNPEFRQHYKTDWHTFNMKQKSKAQLPLSYEGYLEMQIQM